MATKPVEGTQPTKAKSHKKPQKPNFEVPKENGVSSCRKSKKIGQLHSEKKFIMLKAHLKKSEPKNIAPKSDFFKPVSDDGEEIIMCVKAAQ